MIRLATLYFAILFGTGFILGMMRVGLLVPRIGARYAELLELPMMLVVVFIVGRWISRQSSSARQALGVGLLALAMLLSAEMALAAILFQKSPAEALLDRDPVSGTAYYLALSIFALMPWLTFRPPVR